MRPKKMTRNTNLSIYDERTWPAQPVTMTKGTTTVIPVEITYGDGDLYTLEEDEVLRLGIKNSPSSSEYLIVKEATMDDYENGTYYFRLVPSDTFVLRHGDYYYDLGIESGDDYYVVIPNSKFELIQNITLSDEEQSDMNSGLRLFLSKTSNLEQKLHYSQTVAGGSRIDWGDGSPYTVPDQTLVMETHTYASPGRYTLRILADDGVELTLGDGGNNIFGHEGGKGDTSPELLDIVIDDHVVALDAFCLDGCTTLTTVNIPETVVRVDNGVFYGCTGLTDIVIPDTVTTIGTYLFYGCSGLKSATLPSHLTAIPQRTFYDCTSLTSFTFPSGVTEIGAYAFYGCSVLPNVTLPANIQILGEYSFAGCDGFTSFTIPSTLTSKILPHHLLYYCRYITSVTIPEGITQISDNTFGYCIRLASVHIPSTVTTIHIGAFDACMGCASYTVAAGNTSYSAENGVLLSYDKTVAVKLPGSQGSHSIPMSVTSIGPHAAYYMSLDSVSIHGHITSIGDHAFYKCLNLVTLDLDNQITTIGMSAFSNCEKLTSFAFPTGVTHIAQSVLASCSRLTSVTIPNGVASIGASAFSGCSALTSVSIPNSVTEIGGSAFSLCTSLASITIPSSVTTINNGAFQNCRSLTTVTIPNTVTSLGSNVFTGCTGLQTANIAAKSIGKNLFSGCTSLTKVWLRQQVTTVTATPNTASMVLQCENVTIYAYASSKPSGWGAYWNYVTEDTQAPVTWGRTTPPF